MVHFPDMPILVCIADLSKIYQIGLNTLKILNLIKKIFHKKLISRKKYMKNLICRMKTQSTKTSNFPE